MIKKMSQRLLVKISKMPLYWKTWTVTAGTILMTIGVFFIIFGLFASKFLTLSQQRKFDQKAEMIFNEISQGGVNTEKLEEHMLQGFTVFVSQKDQLIFPAFASLVINDGVQFDEKSLEGYYQDDFQSTQPVTQAQLGATTLSNLQESLSVQRQITYQGNQFFVEVYYPVSVNQEDVTAVLMSMIPYLLLTGLGVSFIVSRFYASYVSEKITKINYLLKGMSSSSIELDYQASQGDELKELENNIHAMYQNLQLTMAQLNTEVTTVKRLEKDRQVFMRGATHELKTPIMAMTTMLEGMISQVEGFENHEEYLHKCYARLQSMSRLVNEMLEVSKIESVIYTGETDLAQGTAEVLEVYEYMIKDKELVLNVSEIPCSKINIPSGNLKKILSNLIGNAVKYTPVAGQITINGNHEEWEIRNQMSPEVNLAQKDIFAPFITVASQTDSEFEKSHGLGLYLVATILKQYDYQYDFQIDEDPGEFVFRIKL